jgi:hypothetical protein
MSDEALLAQIRARDYTALQEVRAAHQEVKARFGKLYEQFLAILQRHDPIGIAELPGEYGPEVNTILLRLSEAQSVAALRRVIYEEFVWWFSNAEATSWEERSGNNDAGSEEDYEPIAREIWDVLRNYRATMT